MDERTCRICDDPITDRDFHPEGWKQRTCSITCLRTHWRLKTQRRLGTKTKTDKPCVVCGAPTGVSVGRGRDRLYCPACRWQTQCKVTYKWCLECGALFTAGGRRYSSVRCRECAADHKRKRANDRPVDPTLRTRRRQKLIAHVRALYPDCWICGEGIDLALDAQRDPLASCVDEVIPRKHGGSATEWANLAHAHRICNGKRGVKRVTSELREACLREVASIKEARRGDFPQEARPVAV